MSYGLICDNCEERRATIQVNVICVKRDSDSGAIETHSRNQDWCKECAQNASDQDEPVVGLTWTSKGEWLQGHRRGTFIDTFTVEDSPYKAASCKEAPPSWLISQEAAGIV